MRKNKEIDDTFVGFVAAEKVFHACQSEGVDMQSLLVHEIKHYRDMRRNNKQSYQAVRIRINSYIATLTELIMSSEEVIE